MKYFILILVLMASCLMKTINLKAIDGYDSLYYLKHDETHQMTIEFNRMKYVIEFDRDFNFVINDSIPYNNNFPSNAGLGLIRSFIHDTLMIYSSSYSNSIFLKVLNLQTLNSKVNMLEKSAFLFFDMHYIYYQKIIETNNTNDGLFSESYSKGLYRYNYITGEHEEIDSELCSVMYLASMQETSIFICGYYIEGGDLRCPKGQLYVFDKNMMDLRQLGSSDKFSKEYYSFNFHHANYCGEIQEDFMYKKYFYYTLRIDSDNNYANYKTLYNEWFEEVGRVPERIGRANQEFRGYIIENNEINGYYLNSRIDSLRFNNVVRVRIPVYITPYFDRVAYKIIDNQEIDVADIKGFSNYELRLLRNFIFAKYNYGFKDKYLQAFFNLYYFYSFTKPNNRKRLADVSHLLTPADKANLELIKAAEDRLKD